MNTKDLTVTLVSVTKFLITTKIMKLRFGNFVLININNNLL